MTVVLAPWYTHETATTRQHTGVIIAVLLYQLDTCSLCWVFTSGVMLEFRHRDQNDINVHHVHARESRISTNI